MSKETKTNKFLKAGTTKRKRYKSMGKLQRVYRRFY